MHDLDSTRSMAIKERHERHLYPSSDGQHLFEAGRCLCRPRVKHDSDGTYIFIHVPLDGGEPMGELGISE